MAKIELFPGESFPIGSGLSARQSRNGTIISTENASSKKKRKPPVIASELWKMPDCLKLARLEWASMNPSLRNQLISQMPVLCELRFPADDHNPSNFNRYLNLFSGYYFGNYYANGQLTWISPSGDVVFSEQSYQKPNPNPAMSGNFYIKFNYIPEEGYNCTFENIRINLSTEQIYFDIAFDIDLFSGMLPTSIQFAFASASSDCGLCFYISIPGLTSRPFQDLTHRLIIADFLALGSTESIASFSPSSPLSFSGPLSKYHALSTLILNSGDTVEITVFSVSLYGQSFKIGTFNAVID